MTNNFDRRKFCLSAGGAVVAIATGNGCRHGLNNASDGRLSARPHEGVKTSGNGRIMLELDRERDAILQLPKNLSTALPLLVFLHGAGQSADDMFGYLGDIPEEAGVALLVPHSRYHTWDAIGDSFGPDVQFLNRALQRVFDTVAINPERVAIGGFSDGASYAVSLGLINGDLFTHVVGCSPGFVIESDRHGESRFFISHGTSDHILPIDRCGRKVVAGLRARGYDVTFREFDGDHEIPVEVAREAMSFILGR